MKKIKNFICTLIVCTLIFSIPVSSNTIIPIEANSKISNDLQEKMNSSEDTELIDIYFSIKTLEIDSLKKQLNKTYNFDYDTYQDPELCKDMLVPVVLAELKVSTLYKSAFKDINYDDYKTMRAEDSNIDFALLDKVNEWVGQKVDLYRKAKVEIYSDYYNSARDYIKNKFEGKSYVEIERFGVVSITRAKATKEVINKISNTSFINSVFLYRDSVAESLTSVASTQIGADSSTGTKSILYSPAYNGNNVKIGVIEATKEKNGVVYGRFDPSNKQLQTAISENRLHYIQNGNLSVSAHDHATLVVSEIIGSSVSKAAPDGRIHTFEGIVPKSTVYQTCFSNLNSLSSAINLLVEDYNVSVINLSAALTVFGDNEDLAYSSFYEESDRIVDQLVKEHGITFVVSAGNEGDDGNITSPAKAYNVITVGALSTKTSVFPSRTELLQTVFDVADFSSTYQYHTVLPEKPDIVAPGTYITGIKDNAGNILYDEMYNDSSHPLGDRGGTSFAAPLVTGVAAQVIHADPTLRFHGLAVKAIILGGANKAAVNTNYFTEDHLSSAAGVGMVDSVNSVERADAQTVFSNSFDITSSGCSTTSRYRDIQLIAGKTVRIVMTYNKIYDKTYDEFDTEGYPNQLNFQLYYNRPSGNSSYRQLIESSHTYSINNVKVIECEVPETGSYSIRVALGPGYEKPTSGTVYQQYAVSYGYK